MSKYNIALCDDELTARNTVASLTERWALTRGHDITMTHFPSAESFLFEYSAEQRFDILLLDIEMGAMNGVELAKSLRQKDKLLQIAFITGYSDYISEGYEVAALHYLLKPVSEEKLFSVLDRAAERLKTDAKVIVLETPDETIRVPIYEIRYAEVIKNYVTVHAQSDYTVKMPLRELIDRLDERFIRIGRSYVVNLGMIHRVTKTDIYLRGGETIPLPRGAYDTVNRAIINMK